MAMLPATRCGPAIAPNLDELLYPPWTKPLRDKVVHGSPVPLVNVSREDMPKVGTQLSMHGDPHLTILVGDQKGHRPGTYIQGKNTRRTRFSVLIWIGMRSQRNAREILPTRPPLHARGCYGGIGEK